MKETFDHLPITEFGFHSRMSLKPNATKMEYQKCKFISRPKVRTSFYQSDIDDENRPLSSILRTKHIESNLNLETLDETANSSRHQTNIGCFIDSSGLSENRSNCHPLRRKFTQEEDNRLLKLISVNGSKRWDQIALLMPGRTGRQCRDRFHNYLRPTLKNGPWTEEEDLLLEQKVKEIGRHWNKISRFFNGRSANNIKNRFYTYLEKNRQNRKHRIKAKLNKIDNHPELDLKIGQKKFASEVDENENMFESRRKSIKSPVNKYSQEVNNRHDDVHENLGSLCDPTGKKSKIIFPPIIPPDDSVCAGMNIGTFPNF